jgi:hypothetical protein
MQQRQCAVFAGIVNQQDFSWQRALPHYRAKCLFNGIDAPEARYDYRNWDSLYHSILGKIRLGHPFELKALMPCRRQLSSKINRFAALFPLIRPKSKQPEKTVKRRMKCSGMICRALKVKSVSTNGTVLKGEKFINVANRAS